MMDLHIVHDRWEVPLTLVSLVNSITPLTSFFSFRPLNETVADKNLQYRADCNNRPSNSFSFIPTITVVVLPDSI